MSRIAILLLFLLTGCLKVGPNFRPPCAPEQTHWMEEEVVTHAEESLHFWWQKLDDPELNKIIAIAKEENLDLQAACFRILEARAILGIAVGEFFPQTQEAVGSSTKQHIAKNAPNSRGIDPNFLDTIVGLQVAWELDFWGKFRRGIESAQADYLASFANYDDVLVILLSDVASTYVLLRIFEERMAILFQNVGIQTRSKEIVNAQFQAGAVTELDLQQANTLLYSTQSRLYNLEIGVRTAKNSLATLLGTTPDKIDCLLTSPGTIPTPHESMIEAGIPAELLYRRPDIRRALYETAAQSAKIGIAYSDFFPQISITGFIGINNATGTSSNLGNQKFFSADSLTSSFGPAFRWPLLNYGRITNRVRFEQMRFFELATNYQNSVLLAYQEVENALVAFENNRYEVKKLLESTKAAERSVDLSRTQYVEGIADYTRVLTTQEALLNEQERLVLARGQVVLALIEAYRALGGGWQCN